MFAIEDSLLNKSKLHLLSEKPKESGLILQEDCGFDKEKKDAVAAANLALLANCNKINVPFCNMPKILKATNLVPVASIWEDVKIESNASLALVDENRVKNTS